MCNLTKNAFFIESKKRLLYQRFRGFSSYLYDQKSNKISTDLKKENRYTKLYHAVVFSFTNRNLKYCLAILHEWHVKLAETNFAKNALKSSD